MFQFVVEYLGDFGIDFGEWGVEVMVGYDVFFLMMDLKGVFLLVQVCG